MHTVCIIFVSIFTILRQVITLGLGVYVRGALIRYLQVFFERLFLGAHFRGGTFWNLPYSIENHHSQPKFVYDIKLQNSMLITKPLALLYAATYKTPTVLFIELILRLLNFFLKFVGFANSILSSTNNIFQLKIKMYVGPRFYPRGSLVITLVRSSLYMSVTTSLYFPSFKDSAL